MKSLWQAGALAGVVLLTGAALQAQVSLPQALHDDYAPHWIYDDWDRAVGEAKATGRPILAVVRCVH